MKSLVRARSPRRGAGHRPEAVINGILYAVLLAVKDARRLRNAFLEVARQAAGKRLRRAVLVLEEPEITGARLQEEWEGVAAVIRPELLKRLAVAIHQQGTWGGIPAPPQAGEAAIMAKLVGRERAQRPAGASRGSKAEFEILRVLIRRWLLGQGPVGPGELGKISGASHPTVARALERFGPYLKRHSNRTVELRVFPQDEWVRLLAVADEVRQTVRFVDRSGQARSPDSLLRRMRQLRPPGVAVGGVLGAKHYYPGLDLVGNPRLDLSLHCARKHMDLAFVSRLDPGLEPEARRGAAPALVVHAIRRAEPFFDSAEDALPWADPVECLLDLHEMRLEPQALEFLNSFPATRERLPQHAAAG